MRAVVPYPITGVLGDIFTNLLGRQTEGTDLGSQSRLGSDLTTSHSQVTNIFISIAIGGDCRERKNFAVRNLHDLHLIGVELGSCPMGLMSVQSAILTPRR